MAMLDRRTDQEGSLGGDGASAEALVGRSAAIREVRRAIELLGPADAPVLITGERGTGKELVARGLHTASGRNGQFISVNCAAIPRELSESTLFGHVKGAFTGAHTDQPGAFVLAREGTVFLDEVGELSVEAQGKLLRALDPGEFSAVGSLEVHRVAARVIAATNHPVAPESDGRRSLRGDLYSRLNACEIALPPLRERPGDIPLLVEHFLQGEHVVPEARKLLEAHDWSEGNVRELRNVLARAQALADGGEIHPEHLVEQSVIRAGIPNRGPERGGGSLLLEEVKRGHVLRVLKSVEGNKSAAARLLGINRKTLRTMLRRWDQERRLDGAPGADGA